MLKLYIYPQYGGEDKGDGGVRRVVEAQRALLPAHGCEVVNSPDAADVIAIHIAAGDRLLEKFPDRPIVAHSHGLYWYEYDWGVDWYMKANADCMETIRQADAVTAPSEWVAQALRRNTLRRVTVVRHGIHLQEWPEVRQHRDFVLWNKTRPDPVCDPEPLNRLAKMAPDVPFVTTYGDDKLPNVSVSGTLKYEVAKKAIRDAAVYLCTPRETFGIGTLEAMASGVPVLGWRWGGQVNIVEHGVTGWLAEPGDYEGLLEGLRYCLKNRDQMGRAARKVAEERYTWDGAIAEYAQLYREIVAGWEMVAPKVSVVVPAYGLAEFLPEALQSVAGQSEQDWECIVVDDKSPDRCGEIGEEFAKQDSRFRVIHNQENQYLAGALNTGIAEAKGRYVIPLDADNLLPRRALEVLSSALDQDRSIHIAYGNVEFVDADGHTRTIYAGHEETPGHGGWPVEFKGEWQVRGRSGDRPANLVPSTSMFRRSVWELTGGYRRRYRTAEDADFWTRAASYGFRAKMVTRADTLVYRNRVGSMSRDERLKDWTLWMPWSQDLSLPPAAVISSKQAPVPSHDPPKIAVVIPVGPAHREMVVDALDSVDAQSFRDWECIVVNDSGAPLRWTPSWARVIETPGRIGVAAARNLGIRATSAPLFVPLDADDTLESNALEQMRGVYERFGGYVYCDWYDLWEKKDMEVWKTGEYDAQKLLTGGCLHSVTGLYAKDDWKLVGGYDEALPAWEDWDFQLKLAEVGSCGTRLPLPLFTYRKDAGLRREENQGQFEQSKQAIAEKWSAYFDGRKRLMGCSRCPRGGGGRVTASATPIQPSQSKQAQPPADENGYVVVEYIGLRMGSRTFRGPTGTKYRFSASLTERQKYVLKDDAEFFASNTEFRILTMEKPEEVSA